MNCKFCDAELPVGSNPRRLFCNDAHKMRWHRQQQQDDQQEALLAELEELRTKVTDQAHTIEEQVQEITQLRQRLDVERRYLEDTTPRTFKAWLRKQPSSPWRDRVLSDQTFPARASRALYEAHVRRLCTDQEERDDFVRLWKLMLLSQA